MVPMTHEEAVHEINNMIQGMFILSQMPKLKNIHDSMFKKLVALKESVECNFGYDIETRRIKCPACYNNGISKGCIICGHTGIIDPEDQHLVD